MTEFFRFIALPIGLGLFGFIEPCSIGASLLFLKSVEGKGGSDKLMQATIFTLLRAVLIGLLGIVAILVGARFLAFQKMAWILFGSIYLVIGGFYLAGKAGLFRVSLGPRIGATNGTRRSIVLGILFAFNIPACAAPLLAVLLGMAAAGGASGASLAMGFMSMALFGLALSLPIVAATFFDGARRLLDRLVNLSNKMPRWTGVVLIFLGLWSIRYGLLTPIS